MLPTSHMTHLTALEQFQPLIRLKIKLLNFFWTIGELLLLIGGNDLFEFDHKSSEKTRHLSKSFEKDQVVK